MKFTMACGTWIREHDEIVLDILRKADKMPTVEELMEMTGLRRFRIENTLRMWRIQIRMAESRKRMKDCDGLLDEFLGANWRDELRESEPAEEEAEAEEESDWSSIDWGIASRLRRNEERRAAALPCRRESTLPCCTPSQTVL